MNKNVGAMTPDDSGLDHNTLNALCELIVDSEHKTAPKDPDGGYPLIRTSNMAPGWIDFATAQRVDHETYSKWTRRAIPQEGDIILAREAPVGGVGRVPAGIQPVLGQRTVLLRPDRAKTDGRYLMYRLAAPDHQSRMAEMSTGATVPHLNMADIRAFAIHDLLTLPTQRRIGAVLSAIDELIEINERRIEVLEDLARSLYREWFVRFRFPGHENVDLVDSELGAIPRGWRVEPMAKVAGGARHAITSGPFGSKLGRKDYVEGGVPVIRGANLKLGGGFVDRGFVFVTESKADELASSIAKPKDIVITQRGTLGQVGLVPESPSFDRYVISQSQMKVTIDPQTASAQYVYSVLRSADTTQRILNMAITAGVPHINLALLREMLIVVPPLEAQLRFEGVVGELNRRIELGRQTTVTLSNSRDLLLPRLVTGQLDISDIDLGVLTPPEAA